MKLEPNLVERSKIITFAEPVTTATAASTLALWLAQGAGQYVGGKILASILGDPSLDDVKSWIERAVAEINAYTRQAIEKNEIQKMTANMESVLQNLRQYAGAESETDRLNNRFLLENAILQTREVLSLSSALGLPAILCYANATSLRLMALIAFQSLNGSEATRKEISKTVEDGIAHTQQKAAELEKIWTPIGKTAVPNEACKWRTLTSPGPRNPDIPRATVNVGTCHLWIEGQEREIYSGRQITDAEYHALVQKVQQGFNERYAEAKKLLITPLTELGAEWNKVLISPKIAETWQVFIEQTDDGVLAP